MLEDREVESRQEIGPCGRAEVASGRDDLARLGVGSQSLDRVLWEWSLAKSRERDLPALLAQRVLDPLLFSPAVAIRVLADHLRLPLDVGVRLRGRIGAMNAARSKLGSVISTEMWQDWPTDFGTVFYV